MNDMLQSMRSGNGIVLRPVRGKRLVLAPGMPSKRLLFTSEELGYWLRIPAFGDPAAAQQTFNADMGVLLATLRQRLVRSRQ